MRKSGPTSGTPSAMRAWILIPSPERARGEVGPKRTTLLPAPSLPEDAQRHDLAPEPVVDRVARAIPPAPGAVGADPEDLAQAIGHRGDHRRVVVLASERRAPWRPAWAGRRGTREVGEGPTTAERLASTSAPSRSIGQAEASSRDEGTGATTAPGGRLGCAGSSDGSGSRRRRSVTGKQGPGRVRLARLRGPSPGAGDDHQRPPARPRTIRAAPRSRASGRRRRRRSRRTD